MIHTIAQPPPLPPIPFKVVMLATGLTHAGVYIAPDDIDRFVASAALPLPITTAAGHGGHITRIAREDMDGRVCAVGYGTLETA